MRNIGALYTAEYFAHALGEPYSRENPRWQAFFTNLADNIVTELRPRRVLDVGCAMGLLVEALRDRGVDAWGFDASEYAIGHVRDDMRAYCWTQSVTDEFSGQFDLITCIEVLEHLEPTNAAAAVERLTEHTDQVLFSSTPDDFTEPTHVNVQPPDYWAGLFARHGFFRDLDLDASFVAPQCALFRRQDGPIGSIVRAYERKLWALSRENRALRTTRVTDAERQLAALLTSPGWRVFQSVTGIRQWLAPTGSSRGQLVDRALVRLAGSKRA